MMITIVIIRQLLLKESTKLPWSDMNVPFPPGFGFLLKLLLIHSISHVIRKLIEQGRGSAEEATPC